MRALACDVYRKEYLRSWTQQMHALHAAELRCKLLSRCHPGALTPGFPRSSAFHGGQCSRLRQNKSVTSDSIKNAAFIGRTHILDVDESILASMHFKQLQRLLNQVAENHTFALIVDNGVAHIHVLVLENVEHGQNLTVVGHERLTYHLPRHDQLLQHLQHDHNHGVLASVEGSFDRNDELRNHR